AIDGDRLAVTFAGFVVAVPGSRRGIYVIRICYGIEYADRRCRDFVALALVIIAMHVRDSESADILRRTFRLISGPALRRARQNGGRRLIITGDGDENRVGRRLYQANGGK